MKLLLPGTVTTTYLLKVSKSESKIPSSSNSKKGMKVCTFFFALASKKWLKQIIKLFDEFELVIRGYLTQ